ncbi:MAG TPA: DUF1801 domain-containing protein [Puia sp.]|nr:DUF1801 domain-containing protein [Puia sp.]
MLSDIDHFYLKKDEPVKSCLIALREIILKQDPDIKAAWKYGMPFFCYKGKMFCYLWKHKTIGQPYIGFVEGKHLNHPKLLIEKRARMKIFLCDPEKDLPVKTIEMILKQALGLYKKGIIRI